MKYRTLKSTGILSAAIAGLLSIPLGAHAGAPTYTISAITPTGYSNSYATGVNGSGQVTGYTTIDGLQHAYVYSAGQTTILGAPTVTSGPNAGVYTSTWGNAINDAGQVVGYARVSGTSKSQPVLWQADGTPVFIGAFGELGSGVAYGINNNGVVVGNAQAGNGTANQAFTYTVATGKVAYGTLDASSNQSESFFYGINDSGSIVGDGYVGSATVKTALSADLSSTQVTSITGPSGAAINGHMTAINSAGVAVGYSGNTFAERPFMVLPDGTVQSIDFSALHLTGSIGVTASAINDHGDVVGRATDSSGFGIWLYTDGEAFSLKNQVIDATGWTAMNNVLGINDDGQIVGTGTYNEVTTAFILTAAVPEPASFSLLLVGGAALLLHRRQRRSIG